MMKINHTTIYKIGEYRNHLTELTLGDKISRFGYQASDQAIDQLILNMCCNPEDHELWYARDDGERVGWGHMAKNDDGSWELAVSVQHDQQRKGIGNQLITEMLAWAKFHYITEVYMHCIEDNRVIQHLASKNNLKTKSRGDGERTASIEVPSLTLFESTDQRFKEQTEIIHEIGKLQKRLTNLWLHV
jgi:GNAT superfamily N-acetyltransferase